MTLRVINGEDTPERFVDRKEMAAILGISLPTLDRMVKAGEIPSCTWGRRTRRFRPSVVIARLAQRDVRPIEEDAA